MKYTNITFEKIVQDIKREFEKLNHDAQCYELTIVLPSINMFINGAHGVIFTPNIFSALNSMRIMFEAIGALAYFENNDPDNDSFNSFLHNERIRKTTNVEIVVNNKEKEALYNTLALLKNKNPNNAYLLNILDDLARVIEGKYEKDVSIREQLGNIDDLSRYNNAKKLYDYICKPVHFGSSQIMSILYDPELYGDQILTKWRIGPKLLSRKDRTLMRKIVFSAH